MKKSKSKLSSVSASKTSNTPVHRSEAEVTRMEKTSILYDYLIRSSKVMFKLGGNKVVVIAVADVGEFN